jgi:miniconductance mechanosensitive channel
MQEVLKTFSDWLAKYPLFLNLVKLTALLIVAYLFYKITKKILVATVRKITRKTKTKYDDAFFDDTLLRRISYLIPLFIIDWFSFWIEGWDAFLSQAMHVLVLFASLLVISSFLTSLTHLLEKTSKFKDRPIKGYIQVIKIVVWTWGIILLIGVLTSKDPWAIIGGLGALTAVVILVFRDTILSFVASIQISSYDLVKVGDWIEVPKYGADGDVIDLSLNVVKIQNWDKTISVIPTYKLLDDTFKNWRGMVETGGRRIKRSIYIDQNSVKFVDEKLLEKFEKIELLKDYIARKKKEIEDDNKRHNVNPEVSVNGRRMTNIGTFREYLKAYLKNRTDVNKELTFLVRQLQPGPNGLPIEIYVFANTTEWNKYEEIQADIFDHILAVVPEFELRIFQNPSGSDFKEFGRKIEN